MLMQGTVVLVKERGCTRSRDNNPKVKTWYQREVK